MPFNHDIFLSYAHSDNKPFDHPEGWVDRLDRKLRVRLTQLLGGGGAKVWRDTRIQEHEYFVGSIGDAVSSTLLLLSVASPLYATSAWCGGELKEFCRRAEGKGGVSVGRLSRIFKVVKTHVEEAELPEELRGMLGYRFYDFDDKGRPREFRQDDPPHKDQRYWDKLEDLAQDMAKAVKEFRVNPPGGGGDGSGVEPPPPADPLPLEKKVYLAETVYELLAERDRIRRELQQRGYYVLPDQELPRRAAEFEGAAREALSRCALSVHLIGPAYGAVPEGEEERSVVRWQQELAAERARSDGGFTSIVWMPPGLKPQGARHAAFVEALHTGLGPGAELLQTSVENLKLRVLEKLEPPARAEAPQPPAGAGGVRQVYLICDNRDADDVLGLEDYLFNQGFEVINSAALAADGDLAHAHRESLLNCDAVLIYYGRAGQSWLRSKLWDLQKVQGLGRARPLAAKAVYVGGPQTSEKLRFRTHEMPVIQSFDAFEPEALQPFVRAVREGEGARA